MNYLAHLYLAENTPESILGNFLGDFVKGNAIDCYSDSIKKGIYLHRKVDKFTDSHPIFKESRQLISSNNKRYSGIIIDIFFDHFLANNWSKYSNVSLNNFVANVYEILEENAPILPQRLQAVLPNASSNNWLVSYAKIEGINIALARVSLRLKRENCLGLAIEDLTANYHVLESNFNNFFPEVITYTHNIIKQQQ